jgi:hypothetical protein
VFFRNSVCLACGALLGYEPRLGKLYPLTPSPLAGLCQIPGSGHNLFRRCANLDSPSACNWIYPARESEEGITLCISCRLNRTIPDLSVPENGEYWCRVELAKRRLISSLVALGLPVASRVSEDPKRGLAFDVLRPPLDGPPVLTGHCSGIITLNVEEADNSIRERTREQMHEPYRTLLGHLRHEIGHYYWDRLIGASEWLNGFHELFGDEKRDYAAALQQHHQQGAPADWPQHYVSRYASAHPWEDWAETWAHYLHLIDTLDTAFSFRLDIDSVELRFEGFGSEALGQPEKPSAGEFLRLLNAWARFTAVLNELSRSMGLPDFYPFILSRDAVAKLHFVHTVIERERSTS